MKERKRSFISEVFEYIDKIDLELKSRYLNEMGKRMKKCSYHSLISGVIDR